MVLKTIGLTGATGMLGRHLQSALIRRGIEMRAVSRRPNQEHSAFWDLKEWRLFEELDSLFCGVQAVVHTGAVVHASDANEQQEMFDVNVRACVNLGSWATSRGIPLVHISSASVYADTNKPGIVETDPLRFTGLGGFYQFTKLLSEDVFARMRDQGLKHAVVRPSSLYGLGQPEGKLIANFLATVRRGGLITIVEPADDKVNLIHATDVCSAVLAILEREAWGTFNLATEAISVFALAEACVRAAGQGSVICQKSAGVPRKAVIRFDLDWSRAGQILDWTPRCNIDEGLRMMLEERTIQ